MPAVRTVSDWKVAYPEFGAEFARARDEGFDAIAFECLEIADDARNDYIDRKAEEGDEQAKKAQEYDSEHVQRSKLRIETRLKLLAKWDPKRYGDKIAVGGADDLPAIKGLSDADLDAKIAAAAAALNGVSGDSEE